MEIKQGSGGFPSGFNFDVKGKHIIVKMLKEFDKEKFREFDPWTLAFVSEVEEREKISISKVSLIAASDDISKNKPYVEAFIRRISFLNINNENIDFEIEINGRSVPLYDRSSLFTRPSNEIVRSHIKDRDDKDTPGRLEKDFQAFLYGKGLYGDKHSNTRTNERLAILGIDFSKMKKKGLSIMREFPTGVFNSDISIKISEDSRLLPTDYIDIVTLNKKGNLSLIELKFDDVPKLEAISQILDYSLFFTSYYDKLLSMDIMKKNFGNLRDKTIMCYVVNNRFHDRFNDILKYYSTKNHYYKFKMKKVVLGDISDI